MASLGKSTYQEKVSDLGKIKRPPLKYEHKNLHATNFLIGTDKPNFVTEVKTKYVQQESSVDKSSLKAAQEAMKKSSFEFAHLISPNDPKTQFTSEAKAKFVPAQADLKSLQANKEFSRDLRKAHFAFGSQSGPLVTYKQLYYEQAVAEGAPAKLNREQLNDLKRTHFEMGDCKEKPVSHYTYQHSWIQPVGKATSES